MPLVTWNVLGGGLWWVPGVFWALNKTDRGVNVRLPFGNTYLDQSKTTKRIEGCDLQNSAWATSLLHAIHANRERRNLHRRPTSSGEGT